MTEITVGEHTYRLRKINARTQFDLLRRLGPALPVFWQERRADAPTPIDGARWILGFTSGAMAEMKQADSDFVLTTCLSAVDRASGPGKWSPVSVNGNLMFDDVDVMTMMELTDAVIQDALGGFFARLRGGSAASPERETPAAETP